ncbi:MAG: bifunctional DNA-binding transcriptional regulator/O6-methylguanine-DNA methyltransferase Ada [Acidisphaera sp.]|nr:bifunctional DNA-binding transcriptional regulator/O6-methylguanine-DNA methyltransferase Ada [Acidisphaera sp.]
MHSEADRWSAVRHRDSGADGAFFYAVTTTGVYCRPSCASRPARPENVSFFETRIEAERAGYRPCKRCRPDLPPRAEREAALVTEACRQIETAESLPSLAELAAASGLSPFHFHKLFKRIAGITPKAYASAHRAARVQHGLRSGAKVTETIYDAGFNSAGRFYDAADGMLGMTPSAFRAGGRGETIRHAIGHSSLGSVLVAATARGVCAILLGDDPADLLGDLRRRFPGARLVPAEADFGGCVERVVALVDAPGSGEGLGLPLDIRGTAFQRKVWETLQTIPAGATLSYAELAARVGNPKAVRAVAGACAANALAVAVPCHRVVGAHGGLAGYRWGVARKRRLLEREQA